MPTYTPAPAPATDAIALSLFGEEVPAEAAHSKTLRNLAKLMRDIAEARTLILRQEDHVQDLFRRFEKELKPIQDQYVATRVENLRVLGAALKMPWLKGRNRKRLKDALLELADELEEEFGVDLETERITLLGQVMMTEEEERKYDEMSDRFRVQIEEMFKGGAGSASGPERDSGSARRDAEAHSNEDGRWDGPTDEDAPRRRRKTGKGAPKAATGNAEQALAGDIRALYLLLARALHPDKEADEGRRREKTAWMQKVTAAYGERKLADLLDIMAQNPLDAVGPYLSQAPIKTVQGFAKRLRRELTLLRKQADAVRESVAPPFCDMLGPNGLDEKAFKAHLTGARRQVKFVKERLETYRTRAGVEQLVAVLREYAWRGLM
ncbi:MAG: hypothetical protein M3Y08_02325 [Fibrobacterota bacterium]|nr:hypothetical protein [Fibrobacterota bacterium]